MDTSAVQIFLYLRGVFIQLRHQKIAVDLLLLVIRDRLFHCGVSKDGFHSIYEGVVLDFYQIIKSGFSSDVVREPIPFPVADSERLVFACAVGVAGYTNKLLRLIVAEIGHEIHLPGL